MNDFSGLHLLYVGCSGHNRCARYREMLQLTLAGPQPSILVS